MKNTKRIQTMKARKKIMNKSILMGRLTKEPEIKYTTNNTAVCTFTLAVNRRFKKEGQPSADFINIVTWQKTAEFCSKWFKKGQQVCVVGAIQTRTYDKDGQKIYITEVVADEAYFAEGKGEQTTPEFYGQKVAQIPTSMSGANETEGFYPIDSDLLPF